MSLSNQLTVEVPSETQKGLPTVTDEVDDFLKRAERIATSLNHPQLTAAHLLLAMTLSGYASDQFRKRFPEEGVYLACWQRLAEIRPSKDGKSVSSVDTDVREILTHASDIAGQRDPQNRSTQVGDILQILERATPGGRVDELLKGRASITTADVFSSMREQREEMVNGLQALRSDIAKFEEASRVQISGLVELIRHRSYAFIAVVGVTAATLLLLHVFK